MKWLVGVSLLVLLALFGAGYFLCSGKMGTAEEDNLPDDPTEVKSLTKPKTNVAAKVVKTEPQADAKGTNQLDEAQAKKTPLPATEKPARVYEYLADFAPDKVPADVETEADAKNNTWRVYCLQESATGSLRVEDGEYVPGYRGTKGFVRASIYVNERSNKQWKSDYSWILFESLKMSKGYLYQVPGLDPRQLGLDADAKKVGKATQILIPFRYGERSAGGAKLAELRPPLLDAFNQAGCVDVALSVGDPSDLSNRIRISDSHVNVTYQGVEVVCQDREVEDCLRDKLRTSENKIAEEKSKKSAAEDELKRLKDEQTTAEQPIKRAKEEIEKLDALIKEGENEKLKIKGGGFDSAKNSMRIETQINKLRAAKIVKEAEQQQKKSESNKMRDMEAAVAKQQSVVNGVAKTVAGLEAQLVQQRKAVDESLADIKKGVLPMTATVILDKPPSPKDMR